MFDHLGILYNLYLCLYVSRNIYLCKRLWSVRTEVPEGFKSSCGAGL